MDPLISPIVVLGPTASGKSELAERLAYKYDADILSADSMQIYTGMDIGTAKVVQDLGNVRYHGLDLVDPGTPYSVALYQKMARNVIDALAAENKPCIVCGGTGLYIQSIIYEMNFPDGEQVGNSSRDKYSEYLKEHGASALHAFLAGKDKESARLIHPNNTRRVIRALELYDKGLSYAKGNEKLHCLKKHYASVPLIGLYVDRDILVKRIEARVDDMIASGLVDEVECLIEKGFETALTSPQAIGYKELVAFVKGGRSDLELLSSAIEGIKTATRRYAKRQRSWFRRFDDIKWIDATGGICSSLVSQACEIIDSFGRDLISQQADFA